MTAGRAPENLSEFFVYELDTTLREDGWYWYVGSCPYRRGKHVEFFRERVRMRAMNGDSSETHRARVLKMKRDLIEDRLEWRIWQYLNVYNQRLVVADDGRLQLEDAD